MPNRWSEEVRAGFLVEVMAKVDRYGHTTQGVFVTQPGQVPFVYTVGLCKTVGCEFLIAGLDPRLGAELLNYFADLVDEAYIPVDRALVEVGSNALFQLREMDADDAPVYTLRALYGQHPVWQLVWPDPAGLYPPEGERQFTDYQRIDGSLL